MPLKNGSLSPDYTTQLPTYSRLEIAKRIADDGDLLVIYKNKIYRLNNWIKYHPGGETAILHMVGKDATDEMNAYHSHETLRKKLPLFYFGSVAKEEGEFQSLVPPIQLSTANSGTIKSLEPKTYPALNLHDQHRIIQAYRRLDSKLRFLGFYQCNYWDYGYECIRYIATALIVFLLLYSGTKTWHYCLSALFLGVFWHQVTFTAHDAGHLAITHNYYIDSTAGMLIANLLGEHDPDIQHLPFFAVSTRFLDSLYSTYYKRILTCNQLTTCILQVQHLAYYVVLCFGRFNLHAQSYIYLYKYPRSPFRKCEILGIIIYWCGYTATMPLHVLFTLAHFGMSTDDYGPLESFPAKVLRTTMDVACPAWMDPVHGGLQFQIAHHLFPRMPRHQLRHVSPYVKNFCDEVGLTYNIYGYIASNGKVLGVLKDVAIHVKLMKKVMNEERQKIH
ncbi:unnamed protein product [Didymodactylos carnosus]|uniref:Cytochrome b5 heme-binding domain-containing protein n=1 Tax=Didymodactylos carnosus TaxID=1234261 RepID=A0A814WK91_9BILA|nr:unnamed protein product [Didymodactylos carnosus]CAF1203394.1 unnamed protein product [Didymodactylos carnosus]CAF3736866.1 unnamed protein product [Didymodactylos carnosus]CAF3967775.1 unnamed protein product [Didymodactylos carnosus]